MAKTLVPSAYMGTSPLCPLPPALLLCIFNARQLIYLVQSLDWAVIKQINPLLMVK